MLAFDTPRELGVGRARIEHKFHINNIVYKWNYAVQSCVWAKLYVGSEACMLAFDTH